MFLIFYIYCKGAFSNTGFQMYGHLKVTLYNWLPDWGYGQYDLNSLEFTRISLMSQFLCMFSHSLQECVFPAYWINLCRHVYLL